MRDLLIVLCTLVILAAVLTGGLGTMCAFAIPRDGAFFLGWVVVCAATALVNVALITALKAGRAPRRTLPFVVLAFVDFAVACWLLVSSGHYSALLLMSLLFAIKGVLTLRLPADPQTADPAAEDEDLPSYSDATGYLMSLWFAIKGVFMLLFPEEPQTADPEAEDKALPSYRDAAAPREAADQDP